MKRPNGHFGAVMAATLSWVLSIPLLYAGPPPLARLAVRADQAAGKEAAGKEAAPKEPAAKDPPAPQPALPPPAAEGGPPLIQLHMGNGQEVLKGRLMMEELTIQTEFGTLTVPVDKVRGFRPGLESKTELREKIDALVEQLGSEDAAGRDAAYQQLLRFGPPVLAELRLQLDDENAQRVEHLKKLLEALEKIETDKQLSEGFESENLRPWLREDTLETTDFIVTGKISPSTLKLKTGIGEMTIPLADVARAQREGGGPENVNKTLAVSGQYIAQRSFKSAGVRVERGDEVVLKAEGTVVMTPWGSNALSTPDGVPNYGWYVNGQIPTGALVGRIGNSGQVFKVGSSHRFKATSAGVLHFAVGMHPSYSSQVFPGEYKVKIRIDRDGK